MSSLLFSFQSYAFSLTFVAMFLMDLSSDSQECNSSEIWEEFCHQTGKIGRGSRVAAILSERSCSSSHNSYFFDLYHSIPCVPVDFPTIHQSIEHCIPGGMVTVLPGVYEERVVITKSVQIRAADPTKGAAIVWHGDRAKLSASKDESVVQIEESCAYVSIQNITILHSTNGTDIWNGNCAIFCRGDLTHTYIDRCSIQSDSGRGIVVTNGASVKLNRSSIHDCAATGLYVGDMDSMVEITDCNIIRNGFGPPPVEGSNTASSSSYADNNSQTLMVSAGHSGLYVEAAEAEVRNTLLAGNCLTGLSVVRNGCVHISQCDVTANGMEPIVIFDVIHEDMDESSEGGVFEYGNNFGIGMEDGLGGPIRCPRVRHDFLTKSILNQMYQRYC